MKKIKQLSLIGIFLFTILIITGCTSNTQEINENNNDEIETKIQDTEGTVDDYYVKITNYTISKNTDDKDIIIIDLDWTNNSSETTAFIYALYYQAFQNGYELEDLAHYGENEFDYEGYNLKDLEIEPGKTKSIRIAYLLENITDEIKFEITDSDDEEIVKKTFSIK